MDDTSKTTKKVYSVRIDADGVATAIDQNFSAGTPDEAAQAAAEWLASSCILGQHVIRGEHGRLEVEVDEAQRLKVLPSGTITRKVDNTP